jgi:hypothetical protein
MENSTMTNRNDIPHVVRCCNDPSLDCPYLYPSRAAAEAAIRIKHPRSSVLDHWQPVPYNSFVHGGLYADAPRESYTEAPTVIVPPPIAREVKKPDTMLVMLNKLDEENEALATKLRQVMQERDQERVWRELGRRTNAKLSRDLDATKNQLKALTQAWSDERRAAENACAETMSLREQNAALRTEANQLRIELDRERRNSRNQAKIIRAYRNVEECLDLE